jgi:membrane-bound serine protease (ClpP class)
MTLAVIITLIVFGFVLILVEIFLVPGFVVGVLGGVSVAIGIGMVYSEYGSYPGHIVLVTSLVALGVLISLAFRDGFWDRVAIKDSIDSKAAIYSTKKFKVGEIGETISALRPAGTASFERGKVEVHTESDFILAHQKIEIVKISGSKIFVKQIKN